MARAALALRLLPQPRTARRHHPATVPWPEVLAFLHSRQACSTASSSGGNPPFKPPCPPRWQKCAPPQAFKTALHTGGMYPNAS